MKKVFGLIVTAVIVCVVLATCNFGSLENLDLDNINLDNIKLPSATTPTAPNPEYDEIFTKHNIVDVPAIFRNLEYTAFVSLDSDGWIEKMEYGHKNDTVVELVDTIYCPFYEGTSDSERETFAETAESTYAAYDALDFCTVTHESGDLYHVITLTFTELDNEEHVAALEELDMITGEEGLGLISMEETEKNMLASGFIKNYI